MAFVYYECMLIALAETKSGIYGGKDGAARNEAAVKTSRHLSDNIREWSDSTLYQKCKTYGFNARVWLRKFAGLLPEVNRRQLYRRRGYASLHEFARKLAGMSDYTVDKILNVAAKLEDKPALKEQLIAGSEGWSKIEKVAYIATAQTDEFWAKKVSNLTQWALEAYVQEFRKRAPEGMMPGNDANRVGENNRFEFTLKSDGGNNYQIIQGQAHGQGHLVVEPPDISIGHMHSEFFPTPSAQNFGGQNTFSSTPFSRFSFPVTQELDRELKLLKQQLERQRGQTLAWGEVMEELIRTYHILKTAGDKSDSDPSGGKVRYKQRKTVAICPDCVKENTNAAAEKGETGRHIPADVKKIVDERYHHWCAYPNCKRPPDIYHHTRRFGLTKNHDPDFIVPLCTAHERLAHNGLIANEEQNPASWKLLAEPDKNSEKHTIDQAVNTFRKESG